ncbi:(2Fe-2S) ferredoxin domain-containing protein [Alkalibaculum sp. M08DMB]|uniref:(2Fe-2S) ferredoxin domain-containing protein n=1 Tax=Alkalibaculum sporogenes TaxID=2655001 RepID=A0A6A7KDE7_9FIRM|nr:(2Fe-2S) ferredoxin domain-containing protein [Alkalibaculum sporogenes]MPW27043.1 (2Fe-2S) ferredoxin domain-containing protein [Alkalibaculum sporogenes]
MEKPKYHVFVCGSARLVGENKGFCLQKGAIDIIQNFNEEIQDRGLDSEVMVSSTGCVGLCSMGPVVMIYPQQIWYGKVTSDDVEEIVDALENGETIERLVI